VGLVHEAEDYIGVGFVFCGELGPQRGKMVVSYGTITLADDLSIKSGKVVYINCTRGAGTKTGLQKLVVFAKVCSIQRTA
jgi:hypothetical protein